MNAIDKFVASVKQRIADNSMLDADYKKCECGIWIEPDADACPDCMKFADRDQESDDRYNDPRHGQAAELNRGIP